MEFKTLTYDPTLLKKWKKKLLQKKWHGRYGRIFDKDDLRIAFTQPRYHFGEWFAAIHYAKEGDYVLVEKYLYKNHPRKWKIIQRYFTPKQIAILKYPKPRHQAPDLFIYKGKNYFFVEVKRDGDRLSKSQKQCFRKIEKQLRCKVYILYLKKKNN